MLAKPYYLRFLIAMSCMIIVGLATSAQAWLIKPVMDDIFLAKKYDALMWLPLAIIGTFFFKGAANYIQTVLMSYIGLRIINNLRNKLYDQIQRQSLAFFTQHPTGVLMSRITNDVTSMQSAASEAITSLIKDTFTIISLVGFIFYTDWKLAFIAMIVFPTNRLSHFQIREEDAQSDDIIAR